MRGNEETDQAGSFQARNCAGGKGSMGKSAFAPEHLPD